MAGDPLAAAIAAAAAFLDAWNEEAAAAALVYISDEYSADGNDPADEVITLAVLIGGDETLRSMRRSMAISPSGDILGKLLLLLLLLPQLLLLPKFGRPRPMGM